jgi:phosphodiester glycosidase
VTWLDACRELIEAQGLDPELGEVLRAFGGEHAPGPAELDAPLPLLTLPKRVAEVLGREVDAAQASMFGRRLAAVAGLLEGRATPGARLLLIGLVRRAEQILSDQPPRALRIRALVDFIWSQAVVLNLERSGLPTLEELADSLALDHVAEGLQHGLIEGPSAEGPLHVNVLRARAPRLLTLDARPLTDIVQLAASHGAPAAISGGFFLYSEPDIAPPSRRTDPVGLLVTRGEVKGPPVYRRAAILQDASGGLAIERVGMLGVTLQIGAERLRLGPGTRLVHRGHAREATLAAGERGFAILGTRVVGAASGAGAWLPVPLAGFVLIAPSGPAHEVGAEVHYELPGSPQAAMAGGPLLLGEDPLDLAAEDFAGSAPPLTFSQDETFDRNLLPRLGVGLTGEGDLIAVAVDGRNLERAPGLTLRATGRLLAALGCVRALNLDGGSSKRMVVGGRLVDLSTTEVVASAAGSGQIRPVHSAILFLAAPTRL